MQNGIILTVLLLRNCVFIVLILFIHKIAYQSKICKVEITMLVGNDVYKFVRPLDCCYVYINQVRVLRCILQAQFVHVH